MQDSYIGVDVSKAELVISHDQLRPVSIPHDLRSLTAWLAGLPKRAGITSFWRNWRHKPGCRFMCSTPVMCSSALGHWALGPGVMALIALSLSAICWNTINICTRGKQALKCRSSFTVLLTRRAQVSQHQAALRQTLKTTSLPSEHIDRLNGAFKELLTAIDERVESLIASDPALCQGNQRLLSITGIGPQIGALLTAFSNADAVVAYSGLDPRANDSGTKRGRRRRQQTRTCTAAQADVLGWLRGQPQQSPQTSVRAHTRQRLINDRSDCDPGSQTAADSLCHMEGRDHV